MNDSVPCTKSVNIKGYRQEIKRNGKAAVTTSILMLVEMLLLPHSHHLWSFVTKSV